MFDSWAAHQPCDYGHVRLLSRRAVYPHSPQVTNLRESFGIGCDISRAMRSAGAKVLGLDWRTSITGARQHGGGYLVQATGSSAGSGRPRDAIERTDAVLDEKANPGQSQPRQGAAPPIQRPQASSISEETHSAMSDDRSGV